MQGTEYIRISEFAPLCYYKKLTMALKGRFGGFQLAKIDENCSDSL